MLLAETVIAASITYVIMLLAFYYHRMRKFHVPVMISVVIFDISMPFYLYSTRDWKLQLIEQGDILSFGVWTHFGLLIALFVLYAIQITAGRAILAGKGDESVRTEHRNVGKSILIVRALVILSGAMLINPEIGPPKD